MSAHDRDTLAQVAKTFTSSFECEQLAVFLNIPLTVAHLEREKSGGPEQVALKVLTQWKQMYGNEATDAVLYAALVALGKTELADSLELMALPEGTVPTSGKRSIERSIS